jgi:hypothetical protein
VTRIALGALVVVLAGAGAVVAVFAFAGDEEARARDAAELVPADAHLFVGFNLDLTSEPWVALPRLLDALNVEQEARDGIDESFAEDDIDFEEQVLPIIGEITSIAFAGRALGLEEGDGVVAVATRDVEGLVAFIEDTSDEDIEITRTDDANSGLSFVNFFDREDSSQLSLTSRDGVVYAGLAEDNAGARRAVVSHLDRLERQGPLSDNEEFQELFGETGGNPLVVLWASGLAADAIDDRAFIETLESVEEEGQFDVSSFRLAMAFFVESDGFRAETVWRAASLGDLAPALAERVDLDAAAASVPASTLYFQAQTGLGPGIEALVESLENIDDPVTGEALDMIEQFEEDTGIDLVLDLAANITGTQVFAVGSIVDFPEPTGIEFVLLETQSADEGKLRRDLTVILEHLEDELCDCDTDLAIDTDGGFVRAYWPEGDALDHLAGPALADDPGFRATIARLPDDPALVVYLNVGALPPEIFEEALEESDLNLEVLGGFGLAGTMIDEQTTRITAVLPVDTQ